MNKNKIYFFFYAIIAILFTACNRLDTIEYSPKLTPEAFLSGQHWMRIQLGTLDFILSQPTSSIIVYFVSFFTIFIAYKFLTNTQNQKSRYWFGIGLFLTGFGAILAGTSYQAFGYELKCPGREICRWTNWWEIHYAFFSGLGMNAFLVACAHSNANGSFRKGIINYALINSVVYSSLLFYGAFTPIQFLVSFEFLSLASTPSVFFFIWIYAKAYKQTNDKMSLYLRNTWIILIGVIVLYAVSMILGITQFLWAKGIWFTENDVLHVGMIYWNYYIWKNLPAEIKDLN